MIHRGSSPASVALTARAWPLAATGGDTSPSLYSQTDASPTPHASVGRGGPPSVPATCYPRWLDYELLRTLARAERMLARADRLNMEERNG